MPKVHFVKTARKDNPGGNIKKGESYYWWQFRGLPKSYSKVQPKRSQLTNSPYLKWVYYQLDEFTLEGLTDDDIQSNIEQIKDELEELKDEMQDAIDRMPEQFQDTCLNYDRVPVAEDCISTLDGIDYDELERISRELKEIKEKYVVVAVGGADTDGDSPKEEFDIEQMSSDDKDAYVDLLREREEAVESIYSEVSDSLSNLDM